jgi:hypothetical protein
MFDEAGCLLPQPTIPTSLSRVDETKPGIASLDLGARIDGYLVLRFEFPARVETVHAQRSLTVEPRKDTLLEVLVWATRSMVLTQERQQIFQSNRSFAVMAKGSAQMPQ